MYTETPLHIAAANGHIKCLEILLKNGADVRSQFGEKKSTALHLAAEDDSLECVKLLLDAGADINSRNVDNQTPLHVACLSQSVETVEILIKYGADISLTYRDGRTAIHASIVKEVWYLLLIRDLFQSFIKNKCIIIICYKNIILYNLLIKV